MNTWPQPPLYTHPLQREFIQHIHLHLIMCHVDRQHCSVILYLYLFYLRTRDGTKLQFSFSDDMMDGYSDQLRRGLHPYSGYCIMFIFTTFNRAPLLYPSLNFQYTLSGFTLWEYIPCYFIPHVFVCTLFFLEILDVPTRIW